MSALSRRAFLAGEPLSAMIKRDRDRRGLVLLEKLKWISGKRKIPKLKRHSGTTGGLYGRSCCWAVHVGCASSFSRDQLNANTGESFLCPVWVLLAGIVSQHKVLHKLWKSIVQDALPSLSHQVQLQEDEDAVHQQVENYEDNLLSTHLISNIVHGQQDAAQLVVGSQAVQMGAGVVFARGAGAVCIDWSTIPGVLRGTEVQSPAVYEGPPEPLGSEVSRGHFLDEQTP